MLGPRNLAGSRRDRDVGRQLPEGFEALEPWVEAFALPDSAARAARRQTSSIDALRAFYDQILPLAPQALEELGRRRLGALDAEWETLLKLLLSLAEIAPAIEWYGQPQVVDGFDAERFRLTLQIPDAAPQDLPR